MNREVLGKASKLVVIGLFATFAVLVSAVVLLNMRGLMGLTTIFGAAHAVTFWPFSMHVIRSDAR